MVSVESCYFVSVPLVLSVLNSSEWLVVSLIIILAQVLRSLCVLTSRNYAFARDLLMSLQDGV